MYEFIQGHLVSLSETQAVVNVQGVGYKIFIPCNSQQKFPPLSESLLLFVSLVVRQELHALYGFLTRSERDLFELLLTLSGIGPKTALNLLGHLELAEMQVALLHEEPTPFLKVPGIGKKTAQRLMIDLKDKILNLPCATAPNILVERDALNALQNLGFSLSQAKGAIHSAQKRVAPNCDLSTLIGAALKEKV
jgi:holliday junction DNA helicase RuvA